MSRNRSLEGHEGAAPKLSQRSACGPPAWRWPIRKALAKLGPVFPGHLECNEHEQFPVLLSDVTKQLAQPREQARTFAGLRPIRFAGVPPVCLPACHLWRLIPFVEKLIQRNF